jgi:beta-phosphoglucomutase
MLEAVIFDFDGVVADTMGDNFRAWEKVFLEYGVKIRDVDYFLLEGMGRYEIAHFFVKKYNLDEQLVETMVQKKERYYKLDNHFRIYSEVPEILKLLNSKRIKVGLVTGASRDRIETTLTGDVRKYFNFIITSDEVKNGKPHPEPYLKAIQKLQCKPSSTIVIENAKLGIQSAKAAGCTCIAVQTTLGKEYLTEADEVFSNHHEIFCYFNTNFYEHSEN